MTVLEETITNLDFEVEMDSGVRFYRTMQELLDDLRARADEARRAAGALPWTITSVVNGNNADLIAHIAPLYIRPGSLVRDVTWGKGAFWKKMDTGSITLVGSDIAPHVAVGDVLLADFRALPDADESADVVVLDPPYIHNPGKHITDARYNNAATTGGMSHKDIRALYSEGMAEAMRVLKPGGRLLVKGKDEVESGRQCWSHAELREDAEALGLYARDFFILVPQARTSMNRWSTQKHARKVHSFLWVFEKKVPKRVAKGTVK
ncbi:hypothetical protein [Mycobacteroides abscessus]|uniref:hypothetical protein n=1 Tax=Mycobacteroides abscessus TaxID=36809 RepID=UPI0019D2EA8A|nr:hypothetical protein [Mycobacteroides abscessus]MBN7482125.1 hypothetical protein [Mycobacteroides abscessus subsp. massiliense]